jgi:hypothetical protein
MFLISFFYTGITQATDLKFDKIQNPEKGNQNDVRAITLSDLQGNWKNSWDQEFEVIENIVTIRNGRTVRIEERTNYFYGPHFYLNGFLLKKHSAQGCAESLLVWIDPLQTENDVFWFKQKNIKQEKINPYPKSILKNRNPSDEDNEFNVEKKQIIFGSKDEIQSFSIKDEVTKTNIIERILKSSVASKQIQKEQEKENKIWILEQKMKMQKNLKRKNKKVPSVSPKN